MKKPTYFIFILIGISMLIPYLEGFNGTGLINLYIPLFMGSVFLLFIVNNSAIYIDKLGIPLFLLFNFLNILPVFFEGSTSDLLNFIRYMIVGIVLLVYLSVLISEYLEEFLKAMVLISSVLSLLGVMSIIFGQFDIGILTVGTYHDYRVLGYSYPTTMSLMWNTNYYGVYQLMNLPIFLFLLSKRFSLSLLVLLSLNLLNIFLSGSRSAIFVGLAILIVYVFARSSRLIQLYIVIGSFLFLILNSGIFIDLYENVVIGDKGLNGRDVILEATVMALEQKPWGYGYSNIDNALMDNGAGITTAQSSYLTTLLRSGVIGMILYMTLLIVTGVMFVLTINRKTVLFFTILVIALIDGLVRSYSVGGSGYISSMMTIAIGVIWYENFKRNKTA